MSVVGHILFRGKNLTSTLVPLMHKDKFSEFYAQEAQLITSLEFCVSDQLSKIPLDIALNAMIKVWDACHGNSYNDKTLVSVSHQENFDDDATVICDWRIVDKETHL